MNFPHDRCTKFKDALLFSAPQQNNQALDTFRHVEVHLLYLRKLT